MAAIEKAGYRPGDDISLAHRRRRLGVRARRARTAPLSPRRREARQGSPPHDLIDLYADWVRRLSRSCRSRTASPKDDWDGLGASSRAAARLAGPARRRRPLRHQPGDPRARHRRRRGQRHAHQGEPDRHADRDADAVDMAQDAPAATNVISPPLGRDRGHDDRRPRGRVARRARSRPARPAGATASPSTTACCASRRSWRGSRPIRGAPPSLASARDRSRRSRPARPSRCVRCSRRWSSSSCWCSPPSRSRAGAIWRARARASRRSPPRSPRPRRASRRPKRRIERLKDDPVTLDRLARESSAWCCRRMSSSSCRRRPPPRFPPPCRRPRTTAVFTRCRAATAARPRRRPRRRRCRAGSRGGGAGSGAGSRASTRVAVEDAMALRPAGAVRRAVGGAEEGDAGHAQRGREVHRAGVVGHQQVECGQRRRERRRGRGPGRAPDGSCRSPRAPAPPSRPPSGRRRSICAAGETPPQLGRQVRRSARPAFATVPTRRRAKSPTSGPPRRGRRGRPAPAAPGRAPRSACGQLEARHPGGGCRDAHGGQELGVVLDLRPARPCGGRRDRRGEERAAEVGAVAVAARRCRRAQSSQAARNEFGRTTASSKSAARRRRWRLAVARRAVASGPSTPGKSVRAACSRPWRQHHDLAPARRQRGETGSAMTQSPTQFGATTRVRGAAAGLKLGPLPAVVQPEPALRAGADRPLDAPRDSGGSASTGLVARPRPGPDRRVEDRRGSGRRRDLRRRPGRPGRRCAATGGRPSGWSSRPAEERHVDRPRRRAPAGRSTCPPGPPARAPGTSAHRALLVERDVAVAGAQTLHFAVELGIVGRPADRLIGPCWAPRAARRPPSCRDARR